MLRRPSPSFHSFSEMNDVDDTLFRNLFFVRVLSAFSEDFPIMYSSKLRTLLPALRRQESCKAEIKVRSMHPKSLTEADRSIDFVLTPLHHSVAVCLERGAGPTKGAGGAEAVTACTAVLEGRLGVATMRMWPPPAAAGFASPPPRHRDRQKRRSAASV